MKKIKKAFSIIEVVTASIILSITVFWVFKLIFENQKLINNSSNYNTTLWLTSPLNECIEYIWYNWFVSKNVWDEYNIYFWSSNTECLLSSSWTIIDNISYDFKIEISEHIIDNFIKFRTYINSSKEIEIQNYYKLIK